MLVRSGTTTKALRARVRVRAGAWAFGCVVVTALAATACGGAPSRGTYDAGVYRQGTIAFALPETPSAWRRVDVTDGALAFRDDTNDASVLVNARCHPPDEGTPLVALTNHLLIGSTEREFSTQKVVPFDHREALHTKLHAKWDGVVMAFDIFVLKKDGCVYDFVYIGAPSRFEVGTQVFERFVRGFRTLPGSGTVEG